MHKDNHGLLHELVRLKEVIDQLAYVFHKISVNPHSGENFGTTHVLHTFSHLSTESLHSQPNFLGSRLCEVFCPFV